MERFSFLKTLRKKRGLTQEQVGKLAGMNKSQISRMERGMLGSPETVERIVKALDYEMVVEFRDLRLNKKVPFNKMPDDELIRWLDRCVEETHLHLRKGINLKLLSNETGIPQRRLAAAMRGSRYGSVSSYITDKRIETACRLLRKRPWYTIDSISQDSGFSARRTFQTVFKERMGMTPSEYRYQSSDSPISMTR